MNSSKQRTETYAIEKLPIIRGDFTIRPAEEGDIAAIGHMEQVCFDDPWSLDSIRKEVCANPNALLMVVLQKEQVVAYMGIWLLIDEGHITNIAVLPAQRNKGIAKMLLEVTLALAESRGIYRQTLEVRISNLPAQHLYRRFGFQEVGLRKNYYKNGEAACIMWRDNTPTENTSEHFTSGAMKKE